MAASAERTIVHYSNSQLSKLEHSTYSQRKLLSQYGKPMGFWYAYGEDWKHFVNTGKAGLNKVYTTFRYEFTLPESTFITNVDDASPDYIFELSQSNFDVFMKKYAKHAYNVSKRNMLELALYSLLKDGDSSVLHEISNVEFAEFCETLKEDNDPDIDMIIERIESKFPDVISEFSPSNAALASDGISRYDWMSFWDDISTTLGGVEFHEDLFDIKRWHDIIMPWISTLDIRSGVIFHPETFRDGTLIKQLPKKGGKIIKRRTHRKKKNIRRKTYKRA